MTESCVKKLIKFGYGVLEDNLEKQANSQGYTLGERAEEFEKSKTEILDLWISGILTDSQSDKAIEKLHKQILKSIEIL